MVILVIMYPIFKVLHVGKSNFTADVTVLGRNLCNVNHDNHIMPETTADSSNTNGGDSNPSL
eukprot:scaffold190001_cov25-Prasinocladus_malaysianus.AAC.2